MQLSSNALLKDRATKGCVCRSRTAVTMMKSSTSPESASVAPHTLLKSVVSTASVTSVLK